MIAALSSTAASPTSCPAPHLDLQAEIGLAGGAAYGATRAGLTSLSRSGAARLSGAGVRVNAVVPGPVHTSAAPERIEALGLTILLKRAAQPEEIAEVVACLASAAVSSMTGVTVPIDGGRTAI